MKGRDIRIALIVALVGLAMPLRAQLRSEGPVPADLRMSYEELCQSDLARTKEYVGGRVRHKDDVRRASYYVSKMMAGGRIVYGDPVTRMVERIADTLLSGYPDLRRQLRFYTVLSPDVNAFATVQGMVFVNAGLVAQVEDEAQLAFILSHEIIHYYRNHSLESITGHRKEKTDGVEQERSELNEFLRRHARSREMEAEADSLGIALFYSRSPYAKDAVDGVFDVLQYSALPFDDVPFDRTFLDAPYYKVTADCWLDSVSPISSRDDYDDSRSTHPNLLKRRQASSRVMAGMSGGQRFVAIGSAEFARVQHLARVECVRQEIVYAEFARAFYEAYLLYRRDSSDAEVRSLMGRALYATAKYRNRGITDVTGDYKRVEGEVQQVYHLLRRIDSRQLSLLAVHKLWQLGDGCQPMAEDLMGDLYSVHGMGAADFQRSAPRVATQSDTVAADESGLTKYERIKRKRAAQTEQNPAAYAFTDLLGDSLFAMRLESAMTSAESTGKICLNDHRKQLVYSPTYRVVNSKTGELKPDKSSRKEAELANRIAAVGQRFGLQTVDFSDQSLRKMTSDTQYNDYVAVNEWLQEFWQSKGEFGMLRLSQPAMSRIAERYGTSLLNFTAVLNLENSRVANFVDAWYILPYFPSILYSGIADHEQTAMVSLLVDVQRGEVVNRSESTANHDDTRSLLGSAVYDAYRGGKVCGIEGHRLGLLVGAVPMVYAPYVRPFGSVEFAVGRRSSLALTYVHGFDNDGLDSQIYEKGAQVGLLYRGYTRTEYAPLGHYWGAGATLFTRPSPNRPAVGLSFDIGRNYAFAGRWLLNINLRYNIAFARWDSDVVSHALANALLFSVGIGGLPF